MDDEQFTEMLVNYEDTLLIPSCKEKYCPYCVDEGMSCAVKEHGITNEQGCAEAFMNWLNSEVTNNDKWYE